MPTFSHEGQQIAYTEYGGGPAAVTASGGRGRTARTAPATARPVILIHGLLLSQTMHEPLARELAARGNRAITIDLLGHGESDRPADMWRYSMSFFGEQVVALMDHLELPEAVVLGTSLGANTALEAAALAPDRLRGMVVEMPVLDNALVACAIAFAPLLAGLTLGEPLMRMVAAAARAVPRRLMPFWGNVALDTVRQDPAPSGAVLQGLFFGRVAPHRTVRRTFQTKALIIGHRSDPVHPFSDAGMLADEMPNSELLEANSLLELRFTPERLTGEIAAFLDRCWVEPTAARPRRTRTAGRSTGSAARRPSGSAGPTGS